MTMTKIQGQNKARAGFSYMEVLIALALFTIALIVALPVLTMSGRNLAYAQDTYAAHLAAQRLMLIARDALADGVDPVSMTVQHAADGNYHGFHLWIFAPGGGIQVVFHSEGAPEAEAAIIASAVPELANFYTIMVVVWNEWGHAAGQAIGLLKGESNA